MKLENTFFGLALVYNCAGIFYCVSHTFVALAHLDHLDVVLLSGTGDKFQVLQGHIDLPLPVFALILS